MFLQKDQVLPYLNFYFIFNKNEIPNDFTFKVNVYFLTLIWGQWVNILTFGAYVPFDFFPQLPSWALCSLKNISDFSVPSFFCRFHYYFFHFFFLFMVPREKEKGLRVLK